MTKYNITIKQSNTFKGATFTINKNGSPLNLTGATIQMMVRGTVSSAVLLTLEVGTGLTITNPTGGVFTLNSQIFNLPVGSYGYDILVTLADSTSETYVGGSLTIESVYTHG